jgi:hypothetical protein
MVVAMGRLTSVRLVQDSNTYQSMEVAAGRLTDVRLVQP